MRLKTGLFPLVAIVALLVGSGALYTHLSGARNPDADSLQWGVGKLKPTEMAYYTSRVQRALALWRSGLDGAARDEDGRLKDPFGCLLVIDLTKPAFWVERAGKTLDDTVTDLPGGMKWRLLQSSPSGVRALPVVARFCIRGTSGNDFPETIYLVDEGREPGHIDFSFSSRDSRSSEGVGAFRPPAFPTPESTGETYKSIVVDDDEYIAYAEAVPEKGAAPVETPKRSRGSRAPKARASKQAEAKRASSKAAGLKEADPAADEARTRWYATEKWLYQEIDRQLRRNGIEVAAAQLGPGPDYTAGHAEIQGARHGWANTLRKGGTFVDLALDMDFLGDRQSTWYARTARRPRRGAAASSAPRLEFLMRPESEITPDEQGLLLEQGRKTPQVQRAGKSKWTATAPNGVAVELIAIARNPSAGRKWWGPDGSLLAGGPYYNPQRRDGGQDQVVYEFAWRITCPPHLGDTSATLAFANAAGPYPITLADRYGNPAQEGLEARAYAFPRTVRRTTLWVVIAPDTPSTAWVRLCEISLVPERNQGFKIETGWNPEKQRPF
jgi:hypothetical protein